MLTGSAYADLDRRLAADDAQWRQHYPGEPATRQPLHTVYVPADRVRADLVPRWGAQALAAVAEHGLPYPEELRERVGRKLSTEPVEDLRIDFEDGYGVREDETEDAHARAMAAYVATRPAPFTGIRIKSLEAPTRARAVRTLDRFLDSLGTIPPGFVVTLPKVSSVAQVEAMAALCRRLEPMAGQLRFELQIELPQAVLAADGTVPLARMIHASGGRCTGLHYGTYDYSAALGIAPGHQAADHPAADHAKAVMQVAAAGTGVRLSDGSTNILPVGDTAAVHAAWAVHAALVRRGLERGFYQGWDLHPAQLATRFGTAYAFFRDGAPLAARRLRDYLDRRDGGYLDEPATARMLAAFLRRGLHCGALDPAELDLDPATLDAL
ncbi:aldolase [Catellatospora sp. TT07R-123]|uniref:HpcH/HpaI aldolase/citrate lyase family protein n=1 Tax=Catellatospora sp. TT07R-123 TaxID=2733863 RepID=UPI001B09281C|nr:HpcH/HpaI aldolase/citrate lyase family protein [Catellatospora sp. TT07R-123]GHJ44641.1 aldolase [Catellatospora sp. TT07R-123]